LPRFEERHREGTISAKAHALGTNSCCHLDRLVEIPITCQDGKPEVGIEPADLREETVFETGDDDGRSLLAPRAQQVHQFLLDARIWIPLVLDLDVKLVSGCEKIEDFLDPWNGLRRMRSPVLPGDVHPANLVERQLGDCSGISGRVGQIEIMVDDQNAVFRSVKIEFESRKTANLRFSKGGKRVFRRLLAAPAVGNHGEVSCGTENRNTGSRLHRPTFARLYSSGTSAYQSFETILVP